MSVVVHRTRAILCAILLVAASGHASAQETKEIPWLEETFTGTLVEEDVRNVLRRVLTANAGMQAIFKPGVKAEITLQFTNMPLQAVFNQLIEENELDYSFNPATNTVTIFKKARVAAAPPVREFITPRAVPIDVIHRALQNFGMSVENVIYNTATNTVAISGPPNEVAEIRRLIEQLDKNALELLARKREAEQQAQEQQRIAAEQRQLAEQRAQEQRRIAAEQRRLAEQQALEAERLAVERELEEKRLTEQRALETQRVEEERRRGEQRRAFEARLLDEFLNQEVKIIRLRFAGVGATTKTFQGQTFSVPGIGETIEKILGVPGAAVSVVAGGRTESQALAEAAFLERLGDAAKPVISIDERTNSVIVRGSPKAIEEVEKIIRQLDTPLRMIEIETVIVRASKTAIEELGVAFRGTFQKTRGTVSRSFAIDSGTSGVQADADTLGVDALSLLPVNLVGGLDGSFFIRAGRAFLEVQLSALAQDNRVEVIASPRVITLDNVAARVTKAQNVFITTQASGDTAETLTEIKTGITLDITPSIVPADIA
ncbi:MAG: secretin N-terminal domain-containing protein, partial [Alphaproteobacteria bacterium]